MRVIFLGASAASYAPGLAALLEERHEIACVADPPPAAAERAVLAAAEVLVTIRFGADLLPLPALRLLQVAAAGLDGVALERVPAGVAITNCFGHEAPIAEYVFAALLRRAIPLEAADRELRQGRWTHAAGTRATMHGELAGRTIGLLGFGHIGRAVAERARAFGMRVHVCNRGSVVAAGVDRAWLLPGLHAFLGTLDVLVVSLPLADSTRGLIDAAALAALPAGAFLINVGRGAVVEEAAVYDALRSGRLGGAAIDTWYRYPAPGEARTLPASLPFHELPNLLMTPHFSGWSEGTIDRRCAAIADNINRLARGAALADLIRPGG